MKLFLVVVTLAIAAGCTQTASKIDAGPRWGNLTYVKDPHTGLCFATVGSDGHSPFGFSCVPCTPAVEALLQR